MSKFLDALTNVSSAVELPDDIKATLLTAYEDDLSETNSNADAKIEQLNIDLAAKATSYDELDAKYKNDTVALKAANFDLLRAVPDKNANSNSSADNDFDSEDVDIDDLFSEVKV